MNPTDTLPVRRLTNKPKCASCMGDETNRRGRLRTYVWDDTPMLLCDECIDSWQNIWTGDRFVNPACEADMEGRDALPIPVSPYPYIAVCCGNDIEITGELFAPVACPSCGSTFETVDI